MNWQLSHGFFDWPWWGYVLVVLGLTHITIVAVTLYLHRSETHGALELHPVVSHFFRLWLWVTTGMVTKEWVAVHRKHHAKCETKEDPHSPKWFGIGKVVWEGTVLYKLEAKKAETLEKFGQGTPNDWLERNIYSKHVILGLVIMFLIDIALFGVIGISVGAIQMLWIPFWAAGVINGLGHSYGYQNFKQGERFSNVFESVNIVPWGIIIGGEELHNNHHAFGTSAKFSYYKFEFDLGWGYIRVMEFLGLAKANFIHDKNLRLKQ